MDDLLKKLTILVKTTVADAVDDLSRIGTFSSGDARQAASNQLPVLRKRIEEALAFEDELQKQIDDLQSEVNRLDQLADDALQSGQDDTARRYIDQLQRVQQRLNMMDADLREHRLVTQELISTVNALDESISGASSHEQESQSAPAAKPALPVLEALQDVRNRMTQIGERLNPLQEKVADERPVDQPAATPDVEDDLAKRRKRLSKPE